MSLARWEVSSGFAAATRLEPHQDAEKNVHSKADVHQKASKSKEEKKCCGNFEDPENVEYCWDTDCMDGLSDYTTVDDKHCGSARHCEDEKNEHSKGDVHQKVSISTEGKKCCGNFEDPDNVKYCWDTHCMDGLSDYTTVDDKHCGSATVCEDD